MTTIDNLKKIEQGYAAFNLAQNRDNDGAAVAISKIDKYTGDDPILKANAKYLEKSIERDSRNAVGAAQIFNEMYQEALGKLTVKDMVTHYNSAFGELSDDAKANINNFVGSDKFAGKTLAIIADEIRDAEATKSRSTSSTEQVEAAQAIIDQYETFNALKDTMDISYVTGLGVDSVGKARSNSLEDLATTALM